MFVSLNSKHELLTSMEHMSSPSDFSEVHVTRSLVLCVKCLVMLSVLSSPIEWLPPVWNFVTCITYVCAMPWELSRVSSKTIDVIWLARYTTQMIKIQRFVELQTFEQPRVLLDTLDNSQGIAQTHVKHVTRCQTGGSHSMGEDNTEYPTEHYCEWGVGIVPWRNMIS
jgi:hypothetical protein